MQTLKLELKQLIIDTLALEDLSVDDIGDDMVLFGSEGLGLDSIDALELGVALRKKYHLQLLSNDADNREHFSCINNLTKLISQHLQAATPSEKPV